jgi:hypothetical protein
MWPTSNGYLYTDSNFKCNLPALCDEAGNIADLITNFYQDQTACCCDICSASLLENDLTTTTNPNPNLNPNTILPVVIEGSRDSRNPHTLYAIWPDNHALQGVRRAYQAAAHILVSLCVHCQTRTFTLMETSDHATTAIGANWSLLVANLRKQLTDPGWDKYDHQKAQDRLHRPIAKKLAILSTPSPEPRPQTPTHTHNTTHLQQPTSITELPDDVFGIIGKYLVTAEKHRLATLIQTLYRSWRESSHHPLRQWSHPNNTSLTHAQAAAKNLWTNCDDCGTHRPVSNTITMDACADHAGCCYKTVCSTYCQYRCITHLTDPQSTCNNIIYVHQDDKKHNGEPTTWECNSCHTRAILHEQWWGLSDLEHEARYG